MAFSRLLVANRGEIARRVFRTARGMGITTIAVHSEPDTAEPHVREADDAVALSGSTPTETYLNVDAILAAAKQSGADAIHPGYGFLSENADFAAAVVEAGLTWIGPTPESMEIMGSKLESKKLVESVGVPVLPSLEISGMSTVLSAALSMGMPVLVKASAGGGGKGMRIVSSLDELPETVEAARREARAAFGDSTVFLEKYLKAPRHIEIQVFGDTHGNVISLYERECSIQRRHQKVIEESPSPALGAETRAAMSEAAVTVAKTVGYVGAGTVEFLFEDDRFYFLEMNTRLQVEHPVTEMITGLDLVRLQIEVAAGGSLTGVPRQKGHAIEARLYAEDPVNDFLPVTGSVREFDFQPRDGLRVDSGVEAGSVVSTYYDPLMAKVIAHAPTRDAAAILLAGALRTAKIHGLTTNRALLVRVLEHPDFRAGETDTDFLNRNSPVDLGAPLLDTYEEELAAAAAAIADQADDRSRTAVLGTIPSGWRNSRSRMQRRSYQGGHGLHEIDYSLDSAGFRLGDGRLIRVTSATGELVSLLVDESERRFDVARHGEERYVDSPAGPARLLAEPRFPVAEVDEAAGSLHAQMPGKIIRVEVVRGQQIEEGQVLVVMEAMKMEHTLRAPHRGVVTEVRHAAGEQVETGDVLVVVEQN